MLLSAKLVALLLALLLRTVKRGGLLLQLLLLPAQLPDTLCHRAGLLLF